MGDVELANNFLEDYHRLKNEIHKSDTIILELESGLFEINKNNEECVKNNEECVKNNEEIEYKYYSYGYLPEIFPKSISKNKNFKFYLNYIEPEFIESFKNYKLVGLSKIFTACDLLKKNSLKIDSSCNNFIYKNIFTDNVCLSLCKIKYQGELTSKYIIAFDSEILNSDDIIDIFSNIFYKN